jgi:hypothetical protein
VDLLASMFSPPWREAGENAAQAGDLAQRVTSLQLRDSTGLTPVSPLLPSHPGDKAPDTAYEFVIEF